jgi:hypothetical protein
MRLRELMTAIANQEDHLWTVKNNGFPEGWPGVPFSLERVHHGLYRVGVAFADQTITLVLTTDPSPTNDPLDAELR